MLSEPGSPLSPAETTAIWSGAATHTYRLA
jgi:hypothetical protein